MSRVYSFPPLAKADAKILILGSMPGVASLDAYEYYAHPRNAFWKIIESIFNIDHTLDYSVRCDQLTEQGIAVWDVLQSCQRQGSLDSNIEKDSMQANDFMSFFTAHKNINSVLFNGGMAEQSFNRYVKKELADELQPLSFHRLPSTSPAHAALTVEEKISEWNSVIVSCLNT